MDCSGIATFLPLAGLTALTCTVATASGRERRLTALNLISYCDTR
jgi:hypothetical protein